MAKRLNHSSWFSLGRSIVTWLLTNILYKRSSGIEPTHRGTHFSVQMGFYPCLYLIQICTSKKTRSPSPYKASLVLPFWRRMGLISILSTEWEWPKWFISPEALSRSKAHKPSAWQKKKGCTLVYIFAVEQKSFSHRGGSLPQSGHRGYRECWTPESIYSGFRPDS